ncbi:MAG: LysR substrate-binding domain-containing protein [Pseudomonadota bacterium]
METRLESELLRTFVAVADSGSFTNAAELVHRTQSAVSLQVKRLEDTLGQPMFDRGRRGVTLTPGGEALLSRARPILRLLDQTAGAFAGQALEGTVSVGVPEEYGTSLLPAVLARFAERHPGVQVTVRCEASLALSELIGRGELDIAVLSVSQGDLKGELLIHDPTIWATSARHDVHDLDPLPLAMFDPGCWWRDWALRALDERGRAYRVAYSSASSAGVQAAIAGGLAVGVLGRSTLPSGCRALTPAEGFDDLPGSNVLLRCNSDSPAAEGMAAAIRESFRAVGE